MPNYEDKTETARWMASTQSCQHETLAAWPYFHCTSCGTPRPDPALPDPGRMENEGVSTWPLLLAMGSIGLLMVLIIIIITHSS